MLQMIQREVFPGVRLTAVQTEKFKTCLLGMTFLTPLTQDTATEQALLPSVLRRGTQQHPDMEALAAALDDLYGGSIDAMVRKKGETQCIGFDGVFLEDALVPDGMQILEQATQLMGEVLLHPAGTGNTFVSDYFQSERKNLVQQIRARINNKQQYAMNRLTQLMCQEEAYGIDQLGREEDAHAITEEGLWSRYQSLLKTAPLELYYCGAAPMDRVEAAFRQALKDLPQTKRDPIPDCVADRPAPADAPRLFTDQLDVTQGKLTLGFRIGKSCTRVNDLAQFLTLNAVYGGVTTSKLFMNVRERLSLCYYANSLMDKHKGIMFVISGIEFAKYDQAKEEILAQLEACRKGEISLQELESARRSYVSSLQTTMDAQPRLEDYWLGQAVAGREDSPEALAQAIEQVTLDQVVEAAKQLKLDSIYFMQGKEGAIHGN